MFAPSFPIRIRIRIRIAFIVIVLWRYNETCNSSQLRISVKYLSQAEFQMTPIDEHQRQQFTSALKGIQGQLHNIFLRAVPEGDTKSLAESPTITLASLGKLLCHISPL